MRVAAVESKLLDTRYRVETPEGIALALAPAGVVNLAKGKPVTASDTFLQRQFGDAEKFRGPSGQGFTIEGYYQNGRINTAYPLFTLTRASSSADRKRERSRGLIGFGPPVISPIVCSTGPR